MKKLPSDGFTLIELLIVITIIAVLALMALVIYSNFLKTSRNNKRLSDLKIIQSALEDYNSDQLYYPSSLGNSLTFTVASSTKTYLNTVPTDPKGGSYFYVPSGTDCSTNPQNCTSYCIYANMEGTTTLTSDTGCTSPPTSPPSGFSSYGVSKP